MGSGPPTSSSGAGCGLFVDSAAIGESAVADGDPGLVLVGRRVPRAASAEDDGLRPVEQHAVLGVPAHRARQGAALHVLAEPDDTKRLFSREYFAETQAFATQLRQRTRLDTVVTDYRTLIESTFASKVA